MTERPESAYGGDDWIGMHSFVHLHIDDDCLIDSTIDSGRLQLRLRGECGDAQLTITLDAIDHLTYSLIWARRELRAEKGPGGMRDRLREAVTQAWLRRFQKMHGVLILPGREGGSSTKDGER